MFRTATGDRDQPRFPDGRVRWPYRHSTPGREPHLDLEPFELIRGFGGLHPAARRKLSRVRALLNQAPVLTPAERAAWQSPSPDIEPPEPLPAAEAKPL